MLLTLVAGVLLWGSTPAMQASGAPPGESDPVERCRDPEHRQFDFWVGQWEVRDAEGTRVGHNDIERIAGGCGLLESWRSVDGGRGMSINAYDPDRERWTQRWVGAGATLWLEGGLEDGRMVLSSIGLRRTPRGEVLDRIIWSPLPDGRVRQVWEVSQDEGDSWQTIFVGFYSRSRNASATP